jgi:hypothetical protein
VKDVNANEIKLTSQSIELFVEDKPEIIRTENVIDKFFVELISYNLVRARKSSYINAFIDMKMTQTEAQAAAKSKNKAKDSFRKGFYQFTENKGGKETSSKVNLRKIDNITALNSFPSEIQANIELKISPSLDLELQLPRLKEFQDPSKILRVIRRTAKSVLSEQKSIGKSNLRNYVGLIQNESLINNYVTKDNRFLFSNYLRDVFINQNKEYEYPDTKSIIGSPLIGQNFQNIRYLVNASKPNDETNEKLDLFWLRPSYPFWGRSKESIENINNIKKDLKEDNSRFYLFTDKVNAGLKGWDAKKRYKYYFNSIIELDKIPELENIEIILMRGKFVCLLYYHSIRDDLYRVPFGFMSTHIGIIERIQKRLTEYLTGKIVVDILDYDKTNRSSEFEKETLRLISG